MEAARTTVCISIDLALAPTSAFDVFVEELTIALTQNGMDFEAGSNGRITTEKFEVGRVVTWKSGELIQLQWYPADWKTDEMTNVDLRFELADGGTRVTVEQRGWGGLIGDPGELAGWFAGAVVAPFLQAIAPSAFGNWLTDRRARRPAGILARGVYRDPLYHYPNFYAILRELALSPADSLIEVGCGGGVLLAEALKSGCCAAGIDHSLDMVQLARQVNRVAITEGRLEVRQASADRLPFHDATFTCAVMTGVLGFLPDPVAALRELWRVLSAGGRLVVLGSDPALRGTPAAPEPMASRLRFYQDDELQRLAEEAGIAQAQVVWRDLEPFARQAGLPEAVVAFFVGSGAPFLLARKD